MFLLISKHCKVSSKTIKKWCKSTGFVKYRINECSLSDDDNTAVMLLKEMSIITNVDSYFILVYLLHGAIKVCWNNKTG